MSDTIRRYRDDSGLNEESEELEVSLSSAEEEGTLEAIEDTTATEDSPAAPASEVATEHSDTDPGNSSVCEGMM